MVVVDNDASRFVWAAPGRTDTAVGQFSDLLGEKMRPGYTRRADGADFIDRRSAQRCPNAVRVADQFHVVI